MHESTPEAPPQTAAGAQSSQNHHGAIDQSDDHWGQL